MTSKFRELIPHALVMAIDAIWGWTLSTFGQPLLIELLDRRHWKAVEVFDGLILPAHALSYRDMPVPVRPGASATTTL